MKYALWLSNIKGIGNYKIECLRKVCTCAEEIYYLNQTEIEKIEGITAKDKHQILESKKNWNLEKEFVRLQEKGISFLSQEQKNFPDKLRCISQAPYAIYYIGQLPKENQKSVAIVGSRNRSAYGNKVARELAASMAGCNINVISGMARGIDSDAHLGALEAKGKTYAVLGCGVDICYPSQNEFLYHQIVEKGAVISEYPIGTKPQPCLFPARNRLISALSDKVIIVEAKSKSGSLITADYAMEQGKEVYAVPGRILDPLSQGCNHLIYEGAGIFLGIEQFMEDWKMINNKTCTPLELRIESLGENERKIYKLLDFNPVGIGAVMEQSGMKLELILNVLGILEERGYIQEIIPNYFVKNL